MNFPNLSALAVRERSVTLFFFSCLSLPVSMRFHLWGVPKTHPSLYG